MNTFDLGAWHVFHPSHQRPDKWQALKVLEESAEVVEAAKQAIRSATFLTGDTATARMALTGEIADLLQTIANLCSAFGITADELADAKDACVMRNTERGMFEPGPRTHMHREGVADD